MNNDNNKIDLSHFPITPGVYIMKNINGKIIYIGKAKNLKKRVSSYFARYHKDPKTNVLVSHIENIEFISTNTEAEAFILEDTLIKKHKPRYNIDLKDNKTSPFIKITNEAYPRVIKTRKFINDGAKYFGPYTANMVNQNIKFLHSIFPLRPCKKILPAKTEQARIPCVNYQIGKCGRALYGAYIRRRI